MRHHGPVEHLSACGRYRVSWRSRRTRFLFTGQPSRRSSTQMRVTPNRGRACASSRTRVSQCRLVVRATRAVVPTRNSYLPSSCSCGPRLIRSVVACTPCSSASLGALRSLVRSRLELGPEILALRHELAVLQRQAPRRPRLGRADRGPGGAAVAAGPRCYARAAINRPTALVLVIFAPVIRNIHGRVHCWAGHAASRARRYSWCSPPRIGGAIT